MVKLSSTTVVILAGGMGTRLRSVCSDRPKVLARVKGRPFLSYLLDQISSAGVLKVILGTGYMSDMVEKNYGDTYKSLRLLYSREDKPLGTGGALRLALPLIESQYVLVMNGDSYVDVDLNSYFNWFIKKDQPVSILMCKVPNTVRYGTVRLGINEDVISFKEKGFFKGPGWINAGVYLMKTALLKSIPTGRTFSLEQDLFPSLAGKGLLGYQCKGRFIDIGTPESYATADDFFTVRDIHSVEIKEYDYQQNAI